MTHTGGFSIGFANSDLTINPHFVLMCCDTIVVPALFIQVKVVSEGGIGKADFWGLNKAGFQKLKKAGEYMALVK